MKESGMGPEVQQAIDSANQIMSIGRAKSVCLSYRHMRALLDELRRAESALDLFLRSDDMGQKVRELLAEKEREHEARKQAEQRLEDVYVKDRGKTNEINLLVTENRNLLRERDKARAELASCHERLEDMLGQ